MNQIIYLSAQFVDGILQIRHKIIVGGKPMSILYIISLSSAVL